jgi:predicted RecB family endonuclease
VEVFSKATKAALKNNKYSLLKLEEHLTDIQIEKLSEAKALAPQKILMHAHKEIFRTLLSSA